MNCKNCGHTLWHYHDKSHDEWLHYVNHMFLKCNCEYPEPEGII